MTKSVPVTTDKQSVVLEADAFQALLDVLAHEGRQIIGPTLRDGAIIYEPITHVDDLPVGWTDDQQPGQYRVKNVDDGRFFGYTVSPQSWKKYLYPPDVLLWSARRNGGQMEIDAPEAEQPRFAFVGVRACELAAIQTLDNVLLNSAYADPTYQQRRENTLIIAVNCGRAGNTCFCASMGTGPGSGPGYDLGLTEILAEDDHYFVIDIGTDAGAAIAERLPCRTAADKEMSAAAAVIAQTASHMGRTLETDGLRDLIYRNYDHQQWDDVAARCLSCANCTMVCPTCFCATVEDTTDLYGATAERHRRWDSCFTMDFSYIHGGSVRYSPKARYRQWLTHKLATWNDQFGGFGCVGCGRCIAWCPAGIDITAEVQAIRTAERRPPEEAKSP
jgi:formate hydrogenlyase subunit 6/NADH:ubiquinone oxidoreductase subunit I